MRTHTQPPGHPGTLLILIDEDFPPEASAKVAAHLDAGGTILDLRATNRPPPPVSRRDADEHGLTIAEWSWLMLAIVAGSLLAIVILSGTGQ